MQGSLRLFIKFTAKPGVATEGSEDW
jgi:hypothetical protein